MEEAPTRRRRARERKTIEPSQTFFDDLSKSVGADDLSELPDPPGTQTRTENTAVAVPYSTKAASKISSMNYVSAAPV